MSTLSNRGQACVKPVPEYIQLSFKAWRDEYNAETNPSGYINLSVAENMLSLPYVAKVLAEVPPTPVSSLCYGLDTRLRTAVARYLSKYVTRTRVASTNVIMLNGATAILDTLSNVLCDPGDGVITTGPGYRGIEDDVSFRSDARLFIASLDDNADNGLPVTTVAAFEKAWQDAGAEESRIRMVIVISPNNPTGEVLNRELVLDIVRWGRERKLHMIFDEVYAQSVHNEDATFISVAEVLEGDLGDYVHIVYSFSKDMCISGARIGVLYTQNTELLSTLNGFLFIVSSPSRHTQWAVEHMLKDEQWVEEFLGANKVRLRQSYMKVTSKLEELNIPYMRAEAGFFVWIDLRKWMDGTTGDDEMALFRKLCHARVVLTPSGQCFGKRYGYFRLCFSAVSEDSIEVAWKRLAELLTTCSEK